MDKFIPRARLSKKERRKRDAEKRVQWGFSPVTRTVKSKKLYDRKRLSRENERDGSFYGCIIIP